MIVQQEYYIFTRDKCHMQYAQTFVNTFLVSCTQNLWMAQGQKEKNKSQRCPRRETIGAIIKLQSGDSK